MNPFLLVILAYLVGAIPTSFWVGKVFYGVDLRAKGSGNLGATNAFRVMGWQAALPVVLVDISKGFLPVWAFPQLDAPSVLGFWALAYGAAAIVGHVFSVWVGFRGGKGVATSAGVFLALAPWALSAAFVVWLGIAIITRYASLASILATLTAFAGVLVFPHRGGVELVWFAGILTAFVIWAHRSNIGRLLRGEENRIGATRGTGDPTAADAHAASEDGS